ncbi:hypothetical protein LUZ60_013457 [Juncus effusus]|nr:hypothetical protein LUZ60_013457 [Juncus effusus]
MAAKSCKRVRIESRSASTMLTESVNGYHRFKVEGYSFNKGIGIGKCLTSATFTIGGFDWAIRYYPDGDTEVTKDYLAFFLELRSEATVKAAFAIFLLDQSKPVGLRPSIRVIKPSCVNSTKFDPVIIPPSNLDQQLHCLLESGEGADVSVEVGGEIFRAHKLVLGMRSRVFHAHFFGQMREKHSEHIKLDNIEAEVFRIFLNFIYSDSVSKLVEAFGVAGIQDTINMFQHLLVVADRFGVERLKLICENALSKTLDVNNLATILTLAEQHNCPHLKAACFKYVAFNNNLVAVMGTNEFEHLIQSCPNILKEFADSTSSDK